MSSAAQVAANQANAQLSSGPKTPEGKAKSSRNALKTGLTGRTMILPKGDAELYEQHVLAYAERFNPEGDRGGNGVKDRSLTPFSRFRFRSSVSKGSAIVNRVPSSSWRPATTSGRSSAGLSPPLGRDGPPCGRSRLGN